MMTFVFRFWIAVILGLAGICPAAGASATNAPATNAAAAAPPAAIALPDVVGAAQAALAQLQSDEIQITPDFTAQQVSGQLEDLRQKIDNRRAADERFEQSNPSLGNLQVSQAAWQAIDRALNDAQNDLAARVRNQDTLLAAFNDLEAKWNATLASAKGSSVPAVIQSIQQVLARVADTRKALLGDLNDLYTLQKAVADQSNRVKTGLEAVAQGMTTAQAQLRKQTQPALWNPQAFRSNGMGPVVREKQTMEEQVTGVRDYLAERPGALLIHALLLALLIATFFWIRNVVRDQAKTEEALRDAERIFDAPLSTALLLALVGSVFLYPMDEAPRLLWSIINALALVPTLIIVRRLISADLHPLLYATVAAYFVDQVRYATTPAGVVARDIFLGEMLAACLFLLAALRSKHLCVSSDNPGRVEKVVRGYLHVAYFVFLAAGFANVFGYVPLSFVMGDGMLQSTYRAVVFYAAVRILDAVAMAAMSLRPVRTLGMVRRHHDLVYDKVATTVRWAVVAIWAVMTLQGFFLWDALYTRVSGVLAAKHSWGSIQDIQLGAILAFPITIWLAFALSRLIRFALQEDVYPNLHLQRGIPYAISTVVHYAILVVGFFLALSALGIDLGNYAVLAGAFGVGLGFGLQNIMNNFISGLILLFERPVKVGDTVQIDATTTGRVERIGIRASVILLTNGSELIMPNGNLISNPVTNWTLSNYERLVEVAVNIGPKADAKRALEILLETAKANRAVLKNPPSEALVLTIAAASTALKLRCWVDAEEVDWMKVTSELSLAIPPALERENIPLA